MNPNCTLEARTWPRGWGASPSVGASVHRQMNWADLTEQVILSKTGTSWNRGLRDLGVKYTLLMP